ncbi:DNA double-strand break repair nuclease NurA [Aeropyrum camini]|uniref:NurA domain-containing protein n=1 Tax=Aeropyrum camini SY1 = JCM 12091 TaxID=1198449 RepID=U3TAS8_9CREN|nr:DNA double-strand break repair nuclease NurA [Aeropyrum camini]BAN89531.1 hypothetical protein ACAM_0062 [Aeropyrum camini SY1 = JCM 12091]
MLAVDVASEIASTIAEPPGEYRLHRRPLSLEDLIVYMGDDIEDVTRVSLEEYYSYPLKTVKIKGEGHLSNIYAIDSSSRTIETPLQVILLGAVSLSSRLKTIEADYPSLEKPIGGLKIKPYIVLSRLDIDSWPTPLMGEAYSDILRFSLENAMLKYLLERLEEDRISRTPLSAVIIDGPILNGSVISKLSTTMGDVWRRLYVERQRIIAGFEDLGVPVLGLVKRIESSTLLSKASGYPVMLEECLGFAPKASDSAIIEAAVGYGCHKWRPGYALKTLVSRVVYASGEEKLFEYIVLPGGRYQLLSPKSRVYRLEYTRHSLNLIESYGLKPHHLLIGETLVRGSLEPVTLARSDRRAKSISLALKRIVLSGLKSRGSRVSYSMLFEGELLWRSTS